MIGIRDISWDLLVKCSCVTQTFLPKHSLYTITKCLANEHIGSYGQRHNRKIITPYHIFSFTYFQSLKSKLQTDKQGAQGDLYLRLYTIKIQQEGAIHLGPAHT